MKINQIKAAFDNAGNPIWSVYRRDPKGGIYEWRAVRDTDSPPAEPTLWTFSRHVGRTTGEYRATELQLHRDDVEVFRRIAGAVSIRRYSLCYGQHSRRVNKKARSAAG